MHVATQQSIHLKVFVPLPPKSSPTMDLVEKKQ